MHDLAAIVLGAVGIAFLNLALSGDNGVMMASVVRKLPRGKRLAAISCGAFTAIVVLVTLTYTASHLLELPLIESLAGVVLFWIGANVWRTSSAEAPIQAVPPGLWRAVWLLVSMDVMMSTDNILTVAALSHGRLVPLILGLGFSIPLVIFASALISELMERFPFLIWVAAAIIGRSAITLIVTDDVVARVVPLTPAVLYALQAFGALAVIIAGKLLERRDSRLRVALERLARAPGSP
jgi:YjbE family integral membrane protein